MNVNRRQARGRVYGLEYPEGLIVDYIQSRYHIHENAERIPQIDAGLVARRRTLHSKNVAAKAEAAYPQCGKVEFLV